MLNINLELKKTTLLCLIILFSIKVNSQQFGFTQNQTIKVVENNDTLKNAWAGGLNFCQFSPLDLNLDGIKDLVVFDRSGNRIIPFINNGTSNTIDYKFAPQYISNFPKINNWVLLIDYNTDNKNDIFTYTSGGIAVYKNISTAANGLQFEYALNSPMIYTNYSGTDVNLYVSSVDIPAIVDVDDDGDLDVLTFYILGNYVEYHQNQSMELYGHSDSLTFLVTDRCWGKFLEASASNHVSLHNFCNRSDYNPKNNSARHSGSTLLALDLDGDNDKELILGDVSHDSLVMLTNGGNLDSAYIISQDGSFPSDNLSINIPKFPAAFYLDIDNDGIKDFISSPNIQNISENKQSVWYYKNTGSNNNVILEFQQNDFLQNQMIDIGEGSYPILFDLNSDGLLDLLISSYGEFIGSGNYKSTIFYYKNIGAINNPIFELTDMDFANLSQFGLGNALYPTFGDLDNDNDQDMLIGTYDGVIHYFENTAPQGNFPTFVLNQANFMGIDVGAFATPILIDLNNDNLLDLVIGERDGILNYYKNIGSPTNANYSLETNSFGSINVSDPIFGLGYSVPFVFTHNNQLKILVGSESGAIYYYNNIDNNLNGTFTLQDTLFANINDGIRSAPFLIDINNDSWLDLFIGNYSGGIRYLQGIDSSQISIIETDINIGVYPNPFNNYTTISFNSTPYDILIYNINGTLIEEINNIKTQKYVLRKDNINE